MIDVADARIQKIKSDLDLELFVYYKLISLHNIENKV